MKKTTVLKSTAALVLALAMVLCLAACGGSPNSVEGTWKLKTMNMGGMTFDIDELSSSAGSMGIDASQLEATIVFRGDGTVSMNAASVSGEGTYTVNGSTVSITIDGDTQDVTWNAGEGTLTMSDSGVELIFKR